MTQTIRFDTRIYTISAIERAILIYGKFATFTVHSFENYIDVTITTLEDKFNDIAGEFNNYIINLENHYLHEEIL